jgi:hypothetical protein
MDKPETSPKPGSKLNEFGIPVADAERWKRMHPDELPEHPESNRPRGSGNWIDFSRWPF